MRIKQFVFLLLATVMGGVIEVSAKELKVDLSAGLPQVGGGTATFTYDEASQCGTLEWDSSNSNNLVIIPGFNGDLYEYDEFRIVTEEGTLPEGAEEGSNVLNEYRIVIKFTNGAAQVTKYVEVGEKVLTWDFFGVAETDRHYIENFYLAGTGAWDGDARKKPGNIKVKSISLVGPDIKYIEAAETYVTPQGTIDLKDLTGTNSGWANSIIYPTGFKSQDAVWGSQADDVTNYVSIPEGYNYINFNVSEVVDKGSVRVWVVDDEKQARATIYLNPISDVTNEDVSITAAGTYAVKVTGYTKLLGMKAQNGWEGQGGSGTITINGAYLSKEAPVEYVRSHQYVLAGDTKGDMPSLNAALADKEAILFDATLLTNKEAIELTSANPNCIVLAKEGKISNTSNVSIDGKIHNLVVTDGYPMAVPTGTTAADEASYSREVSKVGTVCLPFTVSSNEDVQFYTIGDLNDGILTLNAAKEVEAGTPAVVEATGKITLTGSSDLAAAGMAEGGMTMIGSYEQKTIVAGDEAIYAISGDELVRATKTITLPAFRAYFVGKNAGAKVRLAMGGNDATAIDSVAEGNATVEGIYSVNGAEQKSLQKGINIIKLSNGKVQKVLVK